MARNMYTIHSVTQVYLVYLIPGMQAQACKKVMLILVNQGSLNRKKKS